MGKATKLLTILLTDSVLEPYFAKLKEQGHIVIVIEPDAHIGSLDDGYCKFSDYDYIYGSKCYRLTPAMLDGLPANTLPGLIKEARGKKYG